MLGAMQNMRDDTRLAAQAPGLSPPSSETLDRLAAVVGTAHTLRDAAALAPFMEEWRGLYRGRTPLLLRPGSTAEVSQILRIAHETGTAIVPQGGNTGLVGGQIPFETGNEVVLNLSRLSRVREVDAANNTLTIEAGATLAQAQEAAAQADRLFPLSLAAEGSCQIGGNLATNAGGIHVLAYGNARALTLGLEVVLADGRVWDGLKGLRKDNTGYDLRDLFIGSEGTLGVITAAVLKLFPRPQEQAVAFVGLESLEHVARLFDLALASAGPALTAFELIPRIGVEFLMKHQPDMRDPLAAPHRWYVLIEICAPRPDGQAAATLESLLESAFESSFIADAALAASLAQAQSFWELRENMSEVQKFEGGSIKHDVSVPVSKIPAFIAQANATIEALVPGARPVPFGHYGDGNIHYNVSQPQGADKDTFLARWDEIADAVHNIVVKLGGSISAEHGIGRMKRKLLPQVKSKVELELMRAIKHTLDPKGILNPGKVL